MEPILKIIPGTFVLLMLTFCTSSSGPGTVISENDVEIHYTVYGKSGPLLVLVHCWCCDQTYWENQVVSMPGAGHFPMLEKPDVFNDLFLKTIAELAEIN